MISDYFAFVIKYISQRRLRSWLTVIGIFIGIAAVVSLISISQGMQDAIQSQFEQLGTDKIIIMPGGGGMAGALSSGFTAGGLTDHDIDIIKKVRGVDAVSGMIYKQATIKFGREIKYTSVIGADPSAEWVFASFNVDGQRLKTGDRYKADIGYRFTTAQVFTKEVKIGSQLDINGQAFKVIGTVQEIGNRQDDSQIYIPIETARTVFNESNQVDMIYARVRNGYDPADVAKDIEDAMRKDRDLKKGEEDFSVQTTEQIASAVQNILGIIQAILVGIAGISLLVGGVGIMNTMYTSVLERTRDIGIMKAIGARNSNIMTIFLIESGFFGLIGGTVGCIFGLAIAKGVEIYAEFAGYPMLKASLSPWLVLLGLGLAFGIGCASGLLPAMQAAKLKPADSLRYE